MDIISPLQWRYAVKQFDANQKIPQSTLEEILEGLRLTPSSFGLQLWKFLVVENDQVKEDLMSMSFKQTQVRDCSHFVIMCSPTLPTHQHVDQYIQDIAQTRGGNPQNLDAFAKVMKDFMDRKDEAGKLKWMDNQIYIALGSLLTLCAMKGIDTCPMEGFLPKKYNQYLNLDAQNLRSVVCCALGYRHQGDKYALETKVRFPTHQVIERIV